MKGDFRLKKLRVGVVGIGHMGQHHARVYKEMSNVEVTALADNDENTLLEVADRLGINSYSDYKELFDKVDAVSIVVPTTFHYDISREFLEHGIHVLVEKPVTRTIQEVTRLNELAKTKNLILQVGHTERFNPAVQSLFQLVENPIIFVEANRLGPASPRNLDIGVVLELMIHDLDIILEIVKSPLKKVNALGVSVYSEYEDIAVAQLLFENGCLATLASSRVTAEKVRKLEVTLEDAFVSVDYIDQNITFRRQVSSRYVFDKKSTRYQRKFLLEKPFISKEEPLKLELDHFVQCIREGKKPVVSGDEACSALLVAEKILGNMEMTNLRMDKSFLDLHKDCQ
ncbi:MAG: putative oxidoreductase YceM [bacterium ADurb.Bin363]|nr:MAG: putative oxidoreductase YceM [bacterium ADurb.Bin363]